MTLHNYKRIYEVAIGRLKEKGVSKENIEAIIKFSNDCFSEGISAGRVVKYVYNLTYLSGWLGKNFEDADKEDIKKLVGGIQKRSDYSEWTKKDYKTCLKKFYRWLKNTEEDPEETKWIKTTMRNNHKKLPDDMLTEEEVKELINMADYPRDKAFVASLYETGCRIGELGTLKIKSVSFDEYGGILLVNGKTGARRVRIISSAPYIRDWINSHPLKDEPESPLWMRKRDLKPFRYEGFVALLKRLKNKSGIKKPVNPHHFRHSRATYLAQHLTEAQMKEYFGWTQASKMAAIYVHLSGRDVDKALLKVYGIKGNGEEKEESKLKPRECGRCKEVNEVTNKFCKKCGFPLDEESKRQIIEKDFEQREASEILDKMLENEEFKIMFTEVAKRVIRK